MDAQECDACEVDRPFSHGRGMTSLSADSSRASIARCVSEVPMERAAMNVIRSERRVVAER